MNYRRIITVSIKIRLYPKNKLIVYLILKIFVFVIKIILWLTFGVGRNLKYTLKCWKLCHCGFWAMICRLCSAPNRKCRSQALSRQSDVFASAYKLQLAFHYVQKIWEQPNIINQKVYVESVVSFHLSHLSCYIIFLTWV